MNANKMIEAIRANNGHKFFDANLNPIQPTPYQWFVEVDLELTEEGEYEAAYEAMVEYRGESEKHLFQDGAMITKKVHRVMQDGSDVDRDLRCTLCILQS